MATVLIGYDTEYHAIGENLARGGGMSFYSELPDDTTASGVEIMTRNHVDLGVRGTIFVCGRTLVHNVPVLAAARDSGVWDIQQHTYSHSLFKDDNWEGGFFPASPPEALRHELVATSGLIAEHLGLECTGLRTPHGYYKGLADRPDMLAILEECGIRFVSSWGRNQDNGNPTPLSIQPYWYADQGYPDILELPFQYWLDGFWFEIHGRDKGEEFKEVLKAAIDEIADTDLVYGACFHEWAMLLYNEAGTGWVRGFIEYALERGVEVMAYGDYYERELRGKVGV
jgi:hypothetical protein